MGWWNKCIELWKPTDKDGGQLRGGGENLLTYCPPIDKDVGYLYNSGKNTSSFSKPNDNFCGSL